MPSGNVNTAEVDDPQLNQQIDEAKQITDPEEAAKAWGDLDKEVTNQVVLHQLAVGQQRRPAGRRT